MALPIGSDTLGGTIPRAGKYGGLLAMGLILFAELMLFSAFISAYLVSRGFATSWPPSDLPTLPVGRTTIYSGFLLLSALTLIFGIRSRRQHQRSKVRFWHWVTVGLGALFVTLQGGEWFRLLEYGLTIRSGSYGRFFYLIIGAHALHAIIGLLMLTWFFPLRRKENLPAVDPVSLYWIFVVTLWPILFGVVYVF